MSKKRANLEMIAPTTEEAVEKALRELGLTENDVTIEILDEGGRGFIGIGGRQARVRLTVKDESAEYVVNKIRESGKKVSFNMNDDDFENLLQIAEATVIELLSKMNVSAEVKARRSDEDQSDGPPNIVVDINGEDLSILIGRRAETLNALQYITRLIVGKELGTAAHIQVDVEGYRARRQRSLERLAHRMANQAVKSGRRQTLEPMPPNERRLVHLALQGNEDVNTESVGEEPYRKVTILPK